MKDSLSKHMESELTACLTIIESALDIANDNNSEQAFISRSDCLEIYVKLRDMKKSECFAISVVESVLNARLFTDYNKSY